MKHMALGIGYRVDEHAAVREEWGKYDVCFDFVNSVSEAAHQIRQREYVCISTFADNIDSGQLERLREVNAPPIVLLSPGCSVAQRTKYLHRGAAEFILNTHHQQNTNASGKDAVQYYLDSSEKVAEALTIITTEDMYFCLEYRTVEVRGQRIDLTAKEFDLLTQLITHPKRVYTYEMLTDLLWGELYNYYSRKAIISHISNLRKKLMVQPDVPDYIVSVRSVGYKFDFDTI